LFKYVVITEISRSAEQFAINRCLLPGNYTWWAVQYGRFYVKQRCMSIGIRLHWRFTVTVAAL